MFLFFVFPLFGLQSTEGRRNAYRAIVQARPPHLNNIYLATQVLILQSLATLLY